MRSVKRVIASFLVVALLASLGTVTAFGATKSVKKGYSWTNSKGGVYTVVSPKAKTVSWKASKKQRAKNKTMSIPKTVKVDGKYQKMTVNTITANALKGIKKLKTIKIYANIKYINKKAFKGVSKAKLAKIKVKMKAGSVTKKTFKALKKALIKKGFKAKNIMWF